MLADRDDPFVERRRVGRRSHHNAATIFLLNLFLGWTFLGWVIALVWSATAVQKPSSNSRSR